MKRAPAASVLLLVLTVPLLALGCRITPMPGPPTGQPQTELRPTALDYVDTDAFDVLFESALVSRDPIILVRTHRPKPDWEGRLNAWIAAWNAGGQAARPTVRGQAPLPKVVIDGDSLRELRLLVASLMSGIEDLGHSSAAWFTEERTRSRREALLKPYSLRFHMDEDRELQLIFFHGDYARYYPDFVGSIAESGPREWTRGVECSRCKQFREGPANSGRLTSRSAQE
jgi:hypothetical protein